MPADLDLGVYGPARDTANGILEGEVGMAGVYRYCHWHNLLCALCVGWNIAGDLPGHHARWSILIFWPHESEPPVWPFKR
jgi:hypothetical protein